MDPQALFRAVDPYVMVLYRLTGSAVVDFLVGTFLLALAAVIVGEYSIAAAFLWPIPFALGWMQFRFSGVVFWDLGPNLHVGYTACFIALYVLACLAFRRVKYRLPGLREIKKVLDSYETRTREMRSFTDLLVPPERTKR